MPAGPPPSNSYGAGAKLAADEIGSSLRPASAAGAHRQPLAGDVPAPAEVLGEIGFILALHLAAAAAATLTLRAFGL